MRTAQENSQGAETVSNASCVGPRRNGQAAQRAMRSGLVVTSISREVRKWYRSAGPDGYAVLRSILQDLVSELEDMERI